MYDTLFDTIERDCRVLESLEIMDYSFLMGIHNLGKCDENDLVEKCNTWGAMPAKNHKGENLLIFTGIIDILQSYGAAKKLEHTWKSVIHDGNTVSVHQPEFYAERFQNFFSEKVFKKIQPIKGINKEQGVTQLVNFFSS